jgi:hypothetical protein
MTRLSVKFGFAARLLATTFVALIAALSSSIALAQTSPCPPGLCVDGQCGTTPACAVPPPPPPSGSGYNIQSKLSALPAAFAGLRLPTSPNITSQVTVTTLAQFQASKNVTGRRTIIPAGTTITFSGNEYLSGTDTELVLQGNLACTGPAWGLMYSRTTRHRTIGSGGELRCRMSGEDAVDLTLYGVVQRASSDTTSENNFWRLNRFAILHSSLRSYLAPLFTHGRPTDVIVANSEIVAESQFTWRSSGMQRAAVLDSYFRIAGGYTFRAHEDATNLYLGNSTFVTGGLYFTPEAGAANSYSLNGIWLVGNKLWQENGLGNNTTVQIGTRVNGVTQSGNEQHTENQSARAGWTIFPRAAPPPWSRAAFSALPPDYVPR